MVTMLSTTRPTSKWRFKVKEGIDQNVIYFRPFDIYKETKNFLDTGDTGII